MTPRWLVAVTAPSALALALIISAPLVSHADPCEQGQHVGNPHCVLDPEPLPQATPELGSGALFGAGALALTGFALVQRRRQPCE